MPSDRRVVVMKPPANGPTAVRTVRWAWQIVQAVADVRDRDDAHVRAELSRLGISEADAPTRVRIVIGGRFDEWPPPLPEVMTVEEFEQRFGAGVHDGRDEAVE